MRWEFGLVALTAACFWAVPSRAAIVLEAGSPIALDSGLLSRTITAHGTAGEQIAGFDFIKLTGAHQVWGLGDQQTIRPPFPAFGWNDAWAAYDSHLLSPAEQVLGSVGAPLMETNDKATTGILCLPPELGMDPPSGFGTLASADGNDAFRLLPQFHSESVPFMQIVSAPGGAHLEVLIAFFEPGVGVVPGAVTRILDTDSLPPPPGHVPELHPIMVDAVIDVTAPQPLSIQLEAVDEETAAANLLWSNLLYCRGPGKDPLFPDAMDAELSSSGLLSWNPLGWRDGAHLFHATVRDEDGNARRGLALSVNLRVIPEPGTFALCGLALVGLAGCLRRRQPKP